MYKVVTVAGVNPSEVQRDAERLINVLADEGYEAQGAISVCVDNSGRYVITQLMVKSQKAIHIK